MEDSGGHPPDGSVPRSPVRGVTRTEAGPISARRRRSYIVVAAAIVVAVIILAIVLMGNLHHAGTSNVVLVPAGAGYSFPVGQFAAVAFTVGSASVITGTLNSSRGVEVYLMTPQQLQAFVKATYVTGYTWGSGWVANETVYALDVPVPAGQWDLAFINPNAGIPTGVGIYTDITLQPA